MSHYLEYATEDVSRKYSGTTCYAVDKTTSEPILVTVGSVRWNDDVNTTEAEIHRVKPDGDLGSGARYPVDTETAKNPPERTTIRLLPLLLRAGYRLVGDSVYRITRKMHKSFMWGASNDGYSAYTENSGLDFNGPSIRRVIMVGKTQGKTSHGTLLDSNFLIDNGTVMLLGVAVGFCKGKEIFGVSPAVAKLLTDIGGEWIIRA